MSTLFKLKNQVSDLLDNFIIVVLIKIKMIIHNQSINNTIKVIVNHFY